MSLKLPRCSLAVVAPITILVMFTVLASSVYIVERKMALAEVIADQKEKGIISGEPCRAVNRVCVTE